jgi:hypothetical protein
MPQDGGQIESQDKLSVGECINAAKTWTDMLFDPGKSWYRELALTGMDLFLRNPGTYETARSRLPQEAYPFPPALVTLEDRVKLRTALQRRQRNRVFELLKGHLVKDPPDRESFRKWFEVMQATANPLVLRKTFLAAADEFKGSQGRQKKIRIDQRFEIASFADEHLTPLILEVLEDQERGTSYSLRELLEIKKRDHPRASTFLLRHLKLFEQALLNQKLLERGKHPRTRAQVLAEAMAGADLGLKFSTSMKRISETRTRS